MNVNFIKHGQKNYWLLNLPTHEWSGRFSRPAYCTWLNDLDSWGELTLLLWPMGCQFYPIPWCKCIEVLQDWNVLELEVHKGISFPWRHLGPRLKCPHGTSVLALNYPRTPQYWVPLQLHQCNSTVALQDLSAPGHLSLRTEVPWGYLSPTKAPWSPDWSAVMEPRP